MDEAHLGYIVPQLPEALEQEIATFIGCYPQYQVARMRQDAISLMHAGVHDPETLLGLLIMLETTRHAYRLVGAEFRYDFEPLSCDDDAVLEAQTWWAARYLRWRKEGTRLRVAISWLRYKLGKRHVQPQRSWRYRDRIAQQRRELEQRR